jgi:RNA recognition motif-containing protein
MRPQKFRGNVFVANLPFGFTDAQLAQAFDQFGMVMGACMARDSTTGMTKGHGLVDLAPSAAAKRAIAEMNGTEIGGRRIEARLADPNMALTIVVPKTERQPEPPAEGARLTLRARPADAPPAPARPRAPVKVEIVRRPRRSQP